MAINSNFGNDTTYNAGRVQAIRLQSYGDALDPLNKAVSELSNARNKRIEAEKRRAFQAQESEKLRSFQNDQAQQKHGWDVERDETKFGQEIEKLQVNHGFRVDEINLENDQANTRMEKKQKYEVENIKTRFDNQKILLDIKAKNDRALQFQKDTAAEARSNAEKRGIDMSMVPDDIYDTTVLKPTKDAQAAVAELGEWKAKKIKTAEQQKNLIARLKKGYNTTIDPKKKAALKEQLDKAISFYDEDLHMGLKNGTVNSADLFIKEKFGDDKKKATEWVARTKGRVIDEEATLKKTKQAQRMLMTIPLKDDQRKFMMKEITSVKNKILENHLAIQKADAEASKAMVEDQSSYNKSVMESDFKSRENYINSEIAALDKNLSRDEKEKQIINIKKTAKRLFPAKNDMVDEEEESKEKKSK